MALPAAVMAGTRIAGIRNATVRTGPGTVLPRRLSTRYKAQERRRVRKNRSEDDTEYARENSHTERLRGRQLAMRERVQGLAQPRRLAEKLRAARATYIIVWFILPFYVVQLMFGVIQFIGAGAELAGEKLLWGAGAWVIPGDELFGAAYVVTTVCAVCLLVATAIIYTLSRVSWMNNRLLMSFMILLAFSFVPFLNIAPWAAFWVFAVARAQVRSTG